MFSGIVEAMGTVVSIEKKQENIDITITCAFVNELKVDQSVSHNGVCLTVVRKTNDTYTVTAIKETLEKSSLGQLQVGSKVNLERSVSASGRFDGHMVQGHVDQTAICTKVEEADGSWYYTFEYEFKNPDHVTVEKGSISVDGVSLTVVNSRDNSFQVAIIPYTYEHTVFHTYKPGTVINLEFDILGKYIAKIVRQVLAK
jgi:riboflavin synthase